MLTQKTHKWGRQIAQHKLLEVSPIPIFPAIPYLPNQPSSDMVHCYYLWSPFIYILLGMSVSKGDWAWIVLLFLPQSVIFFSPAAYLCEGGGCGAGDDAEAHESKCTLTYWEQGVYAYLFSYTMASDSFFKETRHTQFIFRKHNWGTIHKILVIFHFTKGFLRL